MKKSLRPFLAITLICLAAVPFGQARAASSEVATATSLKRMEDSWSKAIMGKDSAAVSNLLADNYAGVNSEGKFQNKTQVVEEMKNSTSKVSAEYNKDMDVHMYAPTFATVRGLTIEKGTDKAGKAYNRTYAWILFWN